MKKNDWLVALTRLRVFAILAGLAWIFGIVPPPGMRIALVALVFAAVVADGWLDQQRLRPGPGADRPWTAPQSRKYDRYQPAA